MAAAWIAAYLLRFEFEWLPPAPAEPLPETYALLGLATLPFWHLLLRHRKLYEPRRGLSRFEEARAVVETCTLACLMLAGVTFFLKEAYISRLFLLIFWVAVSAGIVGFRALSRTLLNAARRRGFNRRTVLIVGTGVLAGGVWERLRDHPETGFQVVGFVGRPRLGPSSRPPVLGDLADLRRLVHELEVDQVLIAFDRSDPVDPVKVVHELNESTAAVRIVMDLAGLPTVQSGFEDLDGLPALRLVESPLVGWNHVLKRLFDVVVSAAALVPLAPVMGIIALAIRWTSPGAPALYTQERMGLDGRLFSMIKFRTMVPEAEKETGPVWTNPDDPRRTRLGGLLRRLNLDELPQLWNVLRGEMSLVGPRPERPMFIREFQRQLPGYMLRHKAKGGMTGWAQVHGYRGNTSIEKRLEYDIEYVRRWSLWLDIKIIGLTLIRSFRDPNAY